MGLTNLEDRLARLGLPKAYKLQEIKLFMLCGANNLNIRFLPERIQKLDG